ncbi:MAG: adenylate kinase [Myxococcota bacterium]|nr:adenylate kinase [Myxococcota bacterium]
MTRIVILGKPGSGKGTQSERICSHYGIVRISTGDLIRAAINDQTELGARFQEFSNKGLLVPDELILEMVTSRLAMNDCAAGFLLDGFPRTMYQAVSLGQWLEKRTLALTTALYLRVPNELLIERATGRRFCAVSGRTYHMIHNPPKMEGLCDVSGEALRERADDKAEVVQRRLEEYEHKTAAVIDFYRGAGNFVEVDGVGDLSTVTSRIFDGVKSSSHAE